MFAIGHATLGSNNAWHCTAPTGRGGLMAGGGGTGPPFAVSFIECYMRSDQRL